MLPIRLFLLAIAFLLASCGGGGGSEPPPPGPDAVTFAFRIQGRGADQEFRYATSSPAFIARARSQLLLPVVGRTQIPTGPIAVGNGGVNLGWGWHFTDLEFADVAIELCDGTPSLVEADLGYWLNTVKRFCPWGGYVYAEVPAADTYAVRQMAVGETREIARENLRITLVDVADSRCPSAAVCVTAGFAAVDLSVQVGSGAPQRVTVTLGAGERDRQAVVAGYRITLDSLVPFPVSGPAPKDQYRADLSVRRPAS